MAKKASKIHSKLTIDQYTFGDLTVLVIPQPNYNPRVEEDVYYNYYVQYHNPHKVLEFNFGAPDKFNEEEITNLYMRGYFDSFEDEDEDED